MNDTDLFAPDLLALRELISARQLRFPDLDAEVLAAALTRVRERHLEVVRAEAVAQAARAALEDEQDALARLGQRAAAYLRVFAEGDAALGATLDGFTLPRPRRAPRTSPTAPSSVEVAEAVGESPAPVAGGADAPRKRGRPRKVVVGAASLFPVAAEAQGVTAGA